MDEEQLVEKEQPTARPRLEYEEGFKRIYIVLVVCWVALLSLMFPIKGDPASRSTGPKFLGRFLGDPRNPASLGLCPFCSELFPGRLKVTTGIRSASSPPRSPAWCSCRTNTSRIRSAGEWSAARFKGRAKVFFRC